MRNKRLLTIFIAILVILFGGLASLKLQFYTDSSNLGFANQIELEAYNEINEQFEASSKNTILILETKKDWATLKELATLSIITNELEKIQGVKTIYSITNLKLPRKGFLGIHHELFLDLTKSQKINRIIENRSDYTATFNKFISPNNHFALLFIAMDSISTNKLNLKKVENRFPNYQFITTNKELFQQQLSATVKKDTLLIAVSAFSLIILSFYFLVRSIKSLILIATSILFNLSIAVIAMTSLQIEFSMQMIALPCIIIVLTITDVLHILYYQTVYKAQVNSDVSLKKKLIDKLKWPLFLTSFSNSIGFIIFLFVAENNVLSELATIVLIGIVSAYLSSRYLVLSYMTKTQDWMKIHTMDKLFTKIELIKHWIQSRKKITFSGFIILSILLLGLFIQHFKIDMNPTDYGQQNDTKSARKILSQNFFGNTQLEVIFNYSHINDKWNKNHLQKVENLINYCDELFNIKHQSSHLTLIKRYNRFNANGLQNAYRIPNFTSPEYLSLLNESTNKLGGKQLSSKGGLTARLKFGFEQKSMYETRKKIRHLKKKLETLFNKQSAKISGKSYLANKGMFDFSYKYILGVLISIIFTVILVIYKLKSIKIGIGMLLVNTVPIIVVILIMFSLNIHLNPLTLFLISALSGLCLDDSIFLVNQNNIIQNKSFIFPVLITTVTLSVGFLALFISEFTWLKNFSILLFIGIWTAFLLDIFILPLFFTPTTDVK